MDGFVDNALAARIEALEARAATDLVALRAGTHTAAEVLVQAGATCAWFAPESVLSHVYGLGLHGRTSAADLEAIEAFYRQKGERRVQVELAPFARRDALGALGQRGYRINGFEQVLARPLEGFAPAPVPPRVRVRAIDPRDPADSALWVRIAAEGFFAPDGVPPHLEGVFELTHRMPGTTPLLALVDGEPAAAAAVQVQGELAALFGAATLERFRRAGAHAALLDARLALARDAGARWA